MKKLLFQKFIQDNLKLFLVVILSIGSIVWIIQSVNFLDFVTEDGHGFKTYLYFSLLNFPKILYRILPFIFFVTLFYQIIRYEENNQLLIFLDTWCKKNSISKYNNSVLSFISTCSNSFGWLYISKKSRCCKKFY